MKMRKEGGMEEEEMNEGEEGSVKMRKGRKR